MHARQQHKLDSTDTVLTWHATANKNLSRFIFQHFETERCNCRDLRAKPERLNTTSQHDMKLSTEHAQTAN